MDVGLAILAQNFRDFDRHREASRGGTNFTPETPDWKIYETELRLGRLAEPLGFNSIWTAEHHFSPYVMVGNPVSLLTYFAGCSDGLNMGSMVMVLPWHDPIRVAEDIVHLDMVLEGRKFYPGLGRGVAKFEYEGMRIPHGESRTRFTECVDIIRLALNGEAFSYEGEHFKIPRVELRPKPRSNPQELIDRLYMAWGSPGSMPMAAEMGLKPLINPQRAWDAYVGELEDFHDIRKTAGYEPARSIIVSWVICAPTAAEAEAKARKFFRENADSSLRHYEMNTSQFENVKGYEYYAENAKKLQKSSDLLTEFTDMFMDTYVWGTPEMCYNKMVAINDKVAPREMVCALNFGDMTPDEAEANMRLFASEVLPMIKKLPLRPIVGTGPRATRSSNDILSKSPATA